MKFPQWITGLLFGYTPSFNPFEQFLLSELMNVCSGDVQKKLMLRINQINRIYRLDGGREINCYVMQNGKPYLPDETRIVDLDGEQTLAQFRIDSLNDLTRNEGKILLVNGNLFSLIFKNPTEHAEVNDIKKVSFQFVE